MPCTVRQRKREREREKSTNYYINDESNTTRMKGPKDLLYIYFVRPNFINLGHEERGLFSPLQRKTNKKFHQKKSIHTCNQHTRMNTPHSVRLAQKLKAKKKEKRGHFPPKKHTYTRVCYTTKACAHIPLQKKKESLQNGAD